MDKLRHLIIALVLVFGVLASGVLAEAPVASAAPRVGAPKLLAAIPTEPESNAGYARSKFRHWIDANRNGCNTRQEVLRAESRRPAKVGRNCSVSGRWFSPFDGVTLRSARNVDIDHFVALAEAWGSGAWRWNADTRMRFANDLGYGPSLIAVSASSNRSKGAKDPAEWLPSRAAYQCKYVAQWVAVKWRWRLSVDQRERTAIRQKFASCPKAQLQVPKPKRARIVADTAPPPPPTTGPTRPPNPGDSKNCSDFATWREAQNWFERYFPFYGDVARLDRDGNRIACESLPGAPRK